MIGLEEDLLPFIIASVRRFFFFLFRNQQYPAFTLGRLIFSSFNDTYFSEGMYDIIGEMSG